MWTALSSGSGGSGLASEGSDEKGVIIPRYADDACEEDGETTDAGDVSILEENDQTQYGRRQRCKMLVNMRKVLTRLIYAKQTVRTNHPTRTQ